MMRSGAAACKYAWMQGEPGLLREVTSPSGTILLSLAVVDASITSRLIQKSLTCHCSKPDWYPARKLHQCGQGAARFGRTGMLRYVEEIEHRLGGDPFHSILIYAPS